MEENGLSDYLSFLQFENDLVKRDDLISFKIFSNIDFEYPKEKKAKKLVRSNNTFLCFTGNLYPSYADMLVANSGNLLLNPTRLPTKSTILISYAGRIYFYMVKLPTYTMETIFPNQDGIFYPLDKIESFGLPRLVALKLRNPDNDIVFHLNLRLSLTNLDPVFDSTPDRSINAYCFMSLFVQ